MTTYSKVKCPNCGATNKDNAIWKNGFVYTISKRGENNEPLETIRKQRYQCKRCGHIWRENHK